MRSFVITAEKTIGGAGGAFARANYLTDEKHPNHLKSKTAIAPIHGKPFACALRAGQELGEVNQALAEAGKGGRPSDVVGMEFMISPPKGTEISDEQAKEAVKEFLATLSTKLKIDPRTLATVSYSTIHRQKNSHINLWVPAHIEGQNVYRRGLSRPSVSNALRYKWNALCLKFWGLNIKEFQPKRPTKTTAAVNSWAEALEREKEIDEKQEVFNKQVKRDLATFSNQLKKWIKSLVDGDKKQERRQANRIKKTADKFENDPFYNDFGAVRGEARQMKKEAEKTAEMLRQQHQKKNHDNNNNKVKI